MSCFISHLGIIISQEQLMVKLVLYINQLLLYLGEVSILLIEPMHIASESNMCGFKYPICMDSNFKDHMFIWSH